MTRHVVFLRQQIEAINLIMEEFDGIKAVDFQFTADDSMEPIRVEYIWEDES